MNYLNNLFKDFIYTILMDNFNVKFENFLFYIKDLFSDNLLIDELLNESTEDRYIRASNLNNSINSITLFNYLLKCKIKLFSHKENDTLIVSESLFGSELSLKKIFNNQDDTIKNKLWDLLYNILLSYNEILLTNDTDNKSINDRINKLRNRTNETSDTKPILPKDGLFKLLNLDNTNDSTNDMINDIFGNFQNAFAENSNPFNNILNITNTIKDKYANKIENGEINLDNLFKNMTNIPGMEGMGDMISNLTKNLGKKESEEKVIIDENFSTADVVQGNIDEQNSNVDISSILKTVSALNGSNPDMPNIGNFMNVFNKLSSTTDLSDINNIISNDLGIDVNKVTDQMSKLLGEND